MDNFFSLFLCNDGHKLRLFLRLRGRRDWGLRISRFFFTFPPAYSGGTRINGKDAAAAAVMDGGKTCLMGNYLQCAGGCLVQVASKNDNYKYDSLLSRVRIPFYNETSRLTREIREERTMLKSRPQQHFSKEAQQLAPKRDEMVEKMKLCSRLQRDFGQSGNGQDGFSGSL